MSQIEWTDVTWNPTTGCTKVSAGCDHCYAETLALGKLKTIYGARLPVVDTPENRADPFAVRLWPERLEKPARWRKPRMVFVNSMSDLFHRDVPTEFARRVFAVMLENPRHTYQVLTKRPSRAERFVRERLAGPLPDHIWIGTSVESQDVAYRVGHLLRVPAAVRFLSCEPLIGPLEIGLLGTAPKDVGPAYQLVRDLIHWVIVGGESGPGYRAMDPAWARSLRDECLAAGVPFFFKQWGGRTPKAGGRDLDGRTWDEYPLPPESEVDVRRSP